MERPHLAVPLAFVLALAAPAAALAQSSSPPEQPRSAIRDQLKEQLVASGPRDGITDFHQSTGNEFAVVGHLESGLKVSEQLEVVALVTKANTMIIMVYPHYHGGYINLRKAKNPSGLMDKLLSLNDSHFFWWGADDEHDIYAAFKITLESGYPKEAVDVIVDSIPNLDETVGELRPFVDTAPKR